MTILIIGFLLTSLLCTIVIISACVLNGRTAPYRSLEFQAKDDKAMEYHQEPAACQAHGYYSNHAGYLAQE